MKIKKLTFSSLNQNLATNIFLYLNISQSYRNYAMPYMTLTYPENIRLLGPSSWEEIESHRTDKTDRQTDHENSTPQPLTCTFPTHSFCSFLIPKPRSLRSLGLDYYLNLVLPKCKPGPSFASLTMLTIKTKYACWEVTIKVMLLGLIYII